MVNTHLLRYYIAVNNDTMEQLADHLDISRSALSAKINNKREFTIKEACDIIVLYHDYTFRRKRQRKNK